MIVIVGDASPRQARGHIGDGCVKWAHFLNDVADVADQTGTVRGWFPYDHNSDCFHMSPTDRGHVAEASPTVTIIWKPGFKNTPNYSGRDSIKRSS